MLLPPDGSTGDPIFAAASGTVTFAPTATMRRVEPTAAAPALDHAPTATSTSTVIVASPIA